MFRRLYKKFKRYLVFLKRGDNMSGSTEYTQKIKELNLKYINNSYNKKILKGFQRLLPSAELLYGKGFRM